MTRDEARQAYGETSLPGIPLTFPRMRALRNAINEEMLSARLMDGTLHMRHSSKIKVHADGVAELRCEAYYFEDREAVTFNSNGFVGFAGWADDEHVQPILRGFMNWVADETAALSNKRTEAA